MFFAEHFKNFFALHSLAFLGVAVQFQWRSAKNAERCANGYASCYLRRRANVGAIPMTDQIVPPQLLLTPKQAALALQLSERTLWELTRRGEIPRLKIGASVRYDVRDLAAFVDAKKNGGVE
jgi:excisionase family DNA binding protein